LEKYRITIHHLAVPIAVHVAVHLAVQI